MLISCLLSKMASKSKTVLIVYAHHYNKSLNAAILNLTVEALKADGCDVMISDLYAQKFNPLIGFHDVKGQVVKEDYRYAEEIPKACRTGNLNDEIVKEQSKLSKADLVIFQFPLVWFSVPAILKGWFDRVLCLEYGMNIEAGQVFERGLLKGKKAILSFTTGGPAPLFTSEGLNGDMDVILYPIHRGPLQTCGFDVLSPNAIYSADVDNRKAIEKALQVWRDRIPKLWTEECIPTLPLDQFDFDKDGILCEDSEYRKSETATVVGIHCGKPISKKD